MEHLPEHHGAGQKPLNLIGTSRRPLPYPPQADRQRRVDEWWTLARRLAGISALPFCYKALPIKTIST